MGSVTVADVPGKRTPGSSSIGGSRRTLVDPAAVAGGGRTVHEGRRQVAPLQTARSGDAEPVLQLAGEPAAGWRPGRMGVRESGEHAGRSERRGDRVEYPQPYR